MNNFFDVEWQEKILLVEIIAFGVLIIIAGNSLQITFCSFAPPLQPGITGAPMMSHYSVIQEFFGREIKNRFTGSLNIQLSIAI